MEQLVLQTDTKRINSEPLIRRIWDSPHAKVRTVRAAIDALSKTKRADADTIAVYSRVVLGIVSNSAHLDHLNISEWSDLVHFCCSAQRRLPRADERAYVKTSTGLFHALRLLLDRPSLVDAAVLPEILTTIGAFDVQGETSSHGYILGCLWRIYVLCWLEFPDVSTKSQEIVREILALVPFRNGVVTVEALIYLSICEPTTIEMEAVRCLTEEFTIPPEDIVFSCGKQLQKGWFQSTHFSARSMSSKTPWLAAAAACNVLEHSQHHLAKRKSHRLLHFALEFKQATGIQFLCFMEEVSLSSHDVRLLLDQLSFGAADLWILLLVSIHGLGDLEYNDLMRVWRACCDRIATPASPGACYALSMCLEKLNHIPEKHTTEILSALITQFEATPSSVPTPMLSSGSLILYKKLSGLQILDQGFQSQKTRLDYWLANALRQALVDKSSKLAPELVAALLGEQFESSHHGYLPDINKGLTSFCGARRKLQSKSMSDSHFPENSQLSQLGLSPLQTQTQHETLEAQSQTQSQFKTQNQSRIFEADRLDSCIKIPRSVLVHALECEPARDKGLMWYYLCRSLDVPASLPVQDPFDMFKEDVEALVAYAGMQMTYPLGNPTVDALRQLKTDWPRSDALFHGTVFNLEPCLPLVSAGDFFDAAPLESSLDTQIFIGKVVLASYPHQRDTNVLEKIMVAITGCSSKAAQDLYNYLFAIVKSHSRFSLLRLSFARFVRSMSDLAELVGSSSDVVTLSLLEYIRFTNDLGNEANSELRLLLRAAEPHAPIIRTEIYISLALRGGDLGMILAQIGRDRDTLALHRISRHFCLPPDELLYRVCGRVFTHWKGSLDTFPFEFFAVQAVDRYALRLPSSLHAEWPAENALFGSRWVRAMALNRTDALHERYGNNRKLASLKTKFDAAIYLHYVQSIPLDSTQWESGPSPVNLNELELEPLAPPDETAAIFSVEEILKQAAELAPVATKYLAMHQGYHIFQSTKSTKVLTALFRGIIVLMRDSIPPLLDFAVHIFHSCAPYAVPSTLVEAFCAAPREFQDRVLIDLEPLVQHPEINFLLELVQNPDASTISTVLSLRFKTPTLPFTLHGYFYRRVIEFVEANPTVSINSAQAEQVLEWQKKYRLPTSNSFDNWAGLMLSQAKIVPVVEPIKPILDPVESLIACLRDVCDNGDYNTLRYLLPFLGRIEDMDVVRSYFPEVDQYALPAELCFDRLTCTDAETPTIEEQAAYLFDSISANPMGEAFRHIPGLALKVLPHLYQMADYEERAQILDTLKAFPEDGAAKWRLILDIFVSKYHDESPSSEWLDDLIEYAVKLQEHELALMFLELQWSRRHYYDEIQYAMIAKSIDDPDLAAGITPQLSLESVAEKLDNWPRLGYELTRYELGDHKALPASLRKVGIFKLAEKVNVPDLFDYSTAWKLQQWDLPAPSNPTTEAEILFALFKQPEVDITKGFGMAWRSAVQNSTGFKTLNTLAEIKGLTIKPLVSLPPTSADENCRQGRELLLSREGNSAMLVTELANTCSWLRENGNTNRALEYSLRLEILAKDSAETAVGLLSMIQSSETAWALGDQSTAIAMLRQVTMHSSFLEVQRTQMYTVAQVYCRLAQMSSAARNERDEGILKNYLEPAMSHTTTSDLETMNKVFHVFASFCDEKYTDPALAAEIDEASRMVASKKAQVKELSDRSQWQGSSRSDQKRAEHVLAKESLLYETEKREYHRLVKKRTAMLRRSVLCYMRSLETGDTFDAHDGCRFVALWLSNSASDDINKIVAQDASQLPTHKVVPWMNQLASCLLDDGTLFQTALKTLLTRVCIEHPYHTLWFILSLCQTSKGTTDVKALARQAAGVRFWKQSLAKPGRVDPNLLAAYNIFANNIISLAGEKVASEQKRTFGFSKLKSTARKWWTITLPELHLPVPTATIPLCQGSKYDQLPMISTVEDSISIANGLSAPKIVKLVDSEGRQHRMLIKGSGDDLRQDAIMEQVFTQANVFFTSKNAARRRKLAIRSYNVVHLGPNAGMIEFVNNTMSLNDVVDPLHREYDAKGWTASRAREVMRKAVAKGREGRIKAFEDLCGHIHPVLRLFFFNTFKDPREWLRARTQYARSSAAISIVGYILGLGDRHCNNILLDVRTGDVVHIDLGIAFDQGKLLRVPETVPFRLSRDVVDGLGATGVQGVFSRCAEITLELLRERRDDILTILEVLRYDPLYQWTVSPLRSRAVQALSAVGANGPVGAASAIGTNSNAGITGQGITSLLGSTTAGPNLGNSVTDGGEADRALRGVRQKLSDGLSSEATVRMLCRQAASVENLGLLFEGWSPFY